MHRDFQSQRIKLARLAVQLRHRALDDLHRPLMIVEKAVIRPEKYLSPYSGSRGSFAPLHPQVAAIVRNRAVWTQTCIRTSYQR